MPRIVHFEVSAEDPDRAVAFYKEALGWDAQKWEGPQDYWLLTTGAEDAPGINGGLNPRTAESLPGATNTIDVASVDDAIARVTAAGGAVVLPKMAVPGVGWLAYFRDTEGNVFGMMEADESASLT